MNSNILVVDVQGFKNNRNEFILKEFAFCALDCTQVFLIKPPYTFSKLTDEEKRIITWVESNYGIYWNQGHIDYREFRRIVKPILNNKLVLVKGNEKTKWIRELSTQCQILDIESKGCPNLNILKSQYTINCNNYNCFSHKKLCALSNVICIKKWCDENNIFHSILI